MKPEFEDGRIKDRGGKNQKRQVINEGTPIRRKTERS
jgi:hypothetical protein